MGTKNPTDFILNPTTQLMDKWDQTDPIRDVSESSLLTYLAEIPECSSVDLSAMLV